MARTFTKNLSNYMELGVASLGNKVTGHSQVSLSAWFNITSTTVGGRNYISVIIINGATPGITLGIDNPSGTTRNVRFAAVSLGGDTESVCLGTTNVSTGVWHHIGGLLDLTPAGVQPRTMTVYLDGEIDGTLSTSNLLAFQNWTVGVPVSPDSIGSYRDPPLATGDQFDGSICRYAVWNTNIGGVNFRALGSFGGGVDPRTIMTSSRVDYFPLNGATSPEPSTDSAVVGTIHGSLPQSTSPPLHGDIFTGGTGAAAGVGRATVSRAASLTGVGTPLFRSTSINSGVFNAAGSVVIFGTPFELPTPAVFNAAGAGLVLSTSPIFFANDIAQLQVLMALGGSYRQTVKNLNPILWYRFAEYTGQTTVYDSSVSAVNGTFAGGITKERAPGVTEGGFAYLFNGTTGKVTVPHSGTKLQVASIFSIEMWVKPRVWKSCSLFETASANGPSIKLRTDGTIAVLQAWSSGSDLARSSIPLDLFAWNHIVWAKNGVVSTVYINGVDATVPNHPTNTISVETAGYLIGGPHASTISPDFFDGDIDETVIYSTELSPSQVISLFNAGLWTDMTGDVSLVDDVVMNRGITGNGPTDLMGDMGQCTLSFDNSEDNLSGLPGLYSTDHANSKSGFTFGVLTKVNFIYGSQQDEILQSPRAKIWPKFTGRIQSIDPDIGTAGDRRTRVVLYDLMDDIGAGKLYNLDLKLNLAEDALLDALLRSLPLTSQPLAWKLDPGLDISPFAFDKLEKGVSPIGPINELLLSSRGYGYITGDGVFRYENRNARALKVSTISYNNNMQGLSVPTSLASVFNHVRVTYHPKTLDTATVVIWSQTGNAVDLDPGETVTIWGNYYKASDPTVSIGGTAQIAPVATTDYLANTLPDGTGTDKTAQLSVTATFFASAVKFDLHNNDAGVISVTKLQVRGKGLYDLSPTLVESVSAQPYGDRILDLDMAFQQKTKTAQALALYVRLQFENFAKQINSITIVGDVSDAFMLQAMGAMIGDRITISETQTGVNFVDAFIQSMSLVEHEGAITVTFGLSSTVYFGSTFWLMGDAVLSVMDGTTILGFV